MLLNAFLKGATNAAAPAVKPIYRTIGMLGGVMGVILVNTWRQMKNEAKIKAEAFDAGRNEGINLVISEMEEVLPEPVAQKAFTAMNAREKVVVFVDPGKQN